MEKTAKTREQLKQEIKLIEDEFEKEVLSKNASLGKLRNLIKKKRELQRQLSNKS